MVGRGAYTPHVERPTEGAHEADEPFSAAGGQVRPVERRAILARCATPAARPPTSPCRIS
jgi:hypothetical protein